MCIGTDALIFICFTKMEYVIMVNSASILVCMWLLCFSLYFFFVQFRDKIFVIEKKNLIHSSQQSDTYISSSLYCVLFVDIKDISINIVKRL